MADEKKPDAAKGRRDRSPSFPFIPLATAIKRLAAFDTHFGRHPALADKIGPLCEDISAAPTDRPTDYLGMGLR